MKNIIVKMNQCNKGNQVQEVNVLFSTVKLVTSRLVIRLKQVTAGLSCMETGYNQVSSQ